LYLSSLDGYSVSTRVKKYKTTFSGGFMNVLDFAIEMENDGFDYYKDLADSSTLPGLKAIFTSLAADELKHAGVFKALNTGETVSKMPASETLETSKNLFKQLPGGTEELKNIADSLKAYQHAMKLGRPCCYRSLKRSIRISTSSKMSITLSMLQINVWSGVNSVT
jgi:rubrerythrin